MTATQAGTRLLAIAILCAPASATRAQEATVPLGAGETTVSVEYDASAVDEALSFDRGFFLRLGGGAPIPLTGPLAEIGNVGGQVRAAAGFHPFTRFAVFCELEASYIPRGKGADNGYGTLGVGLGARAGTLADAALHLFAEGSVILQMVGTAPGTPGLGELSPTLGLSATAGLELDLFEHVSGEGGLRADFLFTHRLWSGTSEAQGASNTFLITPYIAISYYP